MLFGACMMVRNEEGSILVTLNSIKDKVSSLYLYDTLSTDNTVKIVTKYCEDNLIKLHLLEGKFIDFSQSRNKLMDFVDSISDCEFVIHLDSSDQLIVDMKKLEEELKQEECKKYEAFFITQKWREINGEFLTFKNVRLLRVGARWRYKHPVHEVLVPTYSCKDIINERKHIKTEFIIYQDRTTDESIKSVNRYKRDISMFENELKVNVNPRDLYYLAQTYANIGEYDNAIRCLIKHVNFGNYGFTEEYMHSFHRLGCYHFAKKMYDESIMYLSISNSVIERAENYNMIANCYKMKNDINGVFNANEKCMKLEKPIGALLPIKDEDYDYCRYFDHAAIHLNMKKLVEIKKGINSLNLCIAYANKNWSDKIRRGYTMLDNKAKELENLAEMYKKAANLFNYLLSATNKKDGVDREDKRLYEEHKNKV